MWLEQFNIWLFKIINTHHCPFLDRFFTYITHTLFWIPMYILLIVFVLKKIGWKGLGYFLITIGLSDQCSSFWLKPFFKRLRPCYQLQAVHITGQYNGMYGMPSSHASNTFAFATLFCKIFKNKRPYAYLWFIWATIIAYGRIYGGLHYPLDVIFGAVFGATIGWIMNKIYHHK